MPIDLSRRLRSLLADTGVGSLRLGAVQSGEHLRLLLTNEIIRVVRRVSGVSVAIHDTPGNIMERITFYDIDSRRIEKHLTDEERRLYLKEIKADISCFKRSYERADLHVTIVGLDPRPARQPSTPDWAIPKKTRRGANAPPAGLGSLR